MYACTSAATYSGQEKIKFKIKHYKCSAPKTLKQSKQTYYKPLQTKTKKKSPVYIYVWI